MNLIDPALLAAANPDAAREAAEALREEAEHLVRRDPKQLRPLLAALRAAAGRRRDLEPWALWVEGSMEQVRGHPAVAAPLLDRAARSFRREDDEMAAARVDIARMDALACLGHHRSAERCGRRALGTFAAAGDRQRTASALINLGGLADARDRVRDAVALWRRARRLLGAEDLFRRAAVDGSLAGAFQALGRFRTASRLYSDAARRMEQVGATGTALQMRLGLAEVRALLGELGSALTEVESVAARAEELEDDNVLFEARLIAARIELDLGQPQRATEVVDSTLAHCRRAGRHDDAARFVALRALAVAHGAEGNLDEAVSEAESALRRAGLTIEGAALRARLARTGWEAPRARLQRDTVVLEKAGLVGPAALARLSRAVALAARGHHTRAIRLCHEVLQTRHASLWPRFEVHRQLGDLMAESEPAGAIRHLRRAVRLAESVRGSLHSEPDRAAFAARTTAAYERLVELLLRRGDGSSRRQAFDLVARVKSRTLLEALDRRRDAAWKDSPELLQRWNALRRELGAMLAAIDDGGDQRSRYSSAAVAERSGRLAHRLDQLEIEITRSNPALECLFGRLQAPPLRPLLRRGEVFLEMFFVGGDLVVFHLDPTGLRVKVHHGVREVVERRVAAVRFQLDKAAFGRRHLEAPGAFLVRQVRGQLAALGELLLGTLAERPGPLTLLVAPHGALHRLPFAALELGGQPVVASATVAVAPSSATLARLLGRPQVRPRKLGIAGVPRPDLPEIAEEISTIASRFATATRAENASAAEVRSMLKECDAVHIASHGAFQPLLPAGSGIRLADGWLTALDLLRSDIRARLVTLGACASGEVAVAPGDELVGMVRALLSGGIRTAVLALGALDDHVASRAARSFYDRLAELGPGGALRQTQLELRAEYPHPALWAALQLYGDPRPWEVEQ